MRTWPRVVLVVWLALLGSPVAAQNNEVVFYKEVAGWYIYSDRTNGNACFATTFFDEGTYIRIGFNAKNSAAAAYVAFGNEKWRSIEQGKDYDIIIQMDQEKPWNATATGGKIGGIPYLFAGTNAAVFFTEFMRKHRISVTYNNNEIARLSLKGSASAGGAVVECQKLVVGPSNTDPPVTKNDPFDGTAPRNAKDDPFAL
ncbi:MAG: hypothetical protein KF874_12670 [Rhizobiaceae bacterium]|nr:hypothetical protein [Rhizobiaceae bacterium]